ncbi:hypothetical protein C6P42_004331 [Pichia californica]|nr:hypothetical protein C6P42_004331 [[Candida] californica]
MIVDTKVCYDSHCHLSPDITLDKFQEYVKPILESQTWPINIMMTNHIDEKMIIDAISNMGIISNRQIMLNVGIHPWFTHLYTFFNINDFKDLQDFKKFHYMNVLEIYSKSNIKTDEFNEILEYLPIPISIYEIINKFKEILINCKFTERINIGEIGLDKLARIPKSGFLGNPNFPLINGGGLSNYKIKMDHQVEIFKLQFELALNTVNNNIPLPKKISIHCVGCHGLIFEILKKFDSLKIKKDQIPAIVMHSYSGSVDNAKMLMKKLKNLHVWFGISDVINLSKGNQEKFQQLINVIHDKILVETDLGIDRMLENHSDYIEEIVKKLIDLGVDEVTLLDNWRSFTQFETYV